MKKLLSSISMAVLSVCFILQSAQAMKKELDDEGKKTVEAYTPRF